MNYNQGDIVLLPFPFSNFSTSKIRPALIISNPIYNGQGDDIICVPLTSVIKEDKYSITIDNTNLLRGEIITASRIKVDKIFALEKKIILKQIATIQKDILQKVKEIVISTL